MIDIKVIVKGENDLPPFTKIFHYENNSENIFFNAFETIKNRLSQNLRININETLMFFSAYIVSELQNGKSVSKIQENSNQLLSPNQVMFGVPESIQKVTFQVNLDNKEEEITFSEPIQITDYLLLPK